MNRSSFALFVALLIHLLILLLFLILGSMMHDIKKPQEIKKDRIKISLKEMPKKIISKKEIPLVKKQQSPKTLPSKIKPLFQGKQLKKLENSKKVKSVQKPLIKYEKKKPKQTTKIESSATSKPKIKIPPKIEPFIHVKLKKEPKKKIETKYDSYDWLLDDKSSQKIEKKSIKTTNKNSINSNIKELYGSEFSKLSEAQQKYIIDNQEIMRRITQEILDRVASVNLTKDINVNRVNIIEFYLHPNGDMSNFKFLKKSGYYILDRTTQETIEYAYSKYPPVSEKTLIRYNVFYNLLH